MDMFERPVLLFIFPQKIVFRMESIVIEDSHKEVKPEPAEGVSQPKDIGWDIFKQDENCAKKLLNIIGDWIATVLIGIMVVSYWRGTWTLLDIWFCNQPLDASLAAGNTFCYAVESAVDIELWTTRRNSALWCYAIGMLCLIAGTTAVWLGAWRPGNSFTEKLKALRKPGAEISRSFKETQPKVTAFRAFLRFAMVYVLGFSAVSTWRAIWYLQDAYLLPNILTATKSTGGIPIPLASYWTSFGMGLVGSYALCSGASLLAAPAVFLLDGPGINPPPLSVTFLYSYYALKLPAHADPPQLATWLYPLDAFISFVVLPIFVIFYWRGVWLLMDTYLWGLAPIDRAINVSIGYSAALAFLCLMATCEPVQQKIILSNTYGLEVVGRFRTFILAFGSASFWRVVWYFWDQFLGTGHASCWIAHLLGIIGLTMMGSLSSICAPPSTMGVDVVPNPMAAEEPLFDMLPVHWDMLSFMAILRQPDLHNLFQINEKENINAAIEQDNAQIEMPSKTTESEAVRDNLHIRKSRMSSIFSSTSDVKIYLEIQRGDTSLRRSRQDLFDSLRNSNISGVSQGYDEAYGRKLTNQSSFYRNR